MKSKLAASISPLSAAVLNIIRTSSSSRSIVSLFGLNHSQIICRAAYCSVIEDDSFSELGPETSDCSAKQIKLVTEKPEYFLKPDPSRKGLASRSNSSDNRPKSKAAVSAPFRASPTSRPKPGENSDASISPDDSSEISDMESAHSVAIKNICSTVDLSELVEAISVFGKVTGALFVNASNGLKCCHIKFESVDSSRQAVLAGKISVGSQDFPVHPLDTVDVLAVRIKNISQNTSDHDIHRICKSLGELVGLARMSKDSVDAFFTARSEKIHVNMLKRLNSTVLNDCGWSADILRSNSSDEGGRCKLESQISDQISGMRRQNMMDKINLEDLETLLFSILHIQEQDPPSDANTGSS
ncbi:uncharacterized protein [Primulina huaijiensis]|uniref:uncharacterized protein isoform X2 n=1 Tax=Primulina huaijiensis TaxID=1492673 RepID=UPI003CC6F50D